jgi:hypothetical protein
MAKNEGRALKSEEDMLALAEELAARFTPAATGTRRVLQIRPWVACSLSALGGAGLTGLFWWMSLMG